MEKKQILPNYLITVARLLSRRLGCVLGVIDDGVADSLARKHFVTRSGSHNNYFRLDGYPHVGQTIAVKRVCPIGHPGLDSGLEVLKDNPGAYFAFWVESRSSPSVLMIVAGPEDEAVFIAAFANDIHPRPAGWYCTPDDLVVSAWPLPVA